MFKNKSLLLAVALIYTFLLLYFSLANADGIMPETGFKFQDKIVHFVAYIGLAILWGLFAVNIERKRAIFLSFFATLIFGIFLELIQEKVNPLRTYDILDLLANCLGVFSGTVFVLLYSRK